MIRSSEWRERDRGPGKPGNRRRFVRGGSPRRRGVLIAPWQTREASPSTFLLKAAGLHIQWHEFVKPHTIAGEPEIEVIRNFIQGCYE